jgi:hypothetical protein
VASPQENPVHISLFILLDLITPVKFVEAFIISLLYYIAFNITAVAETAR